VQRTAIDAFGVQRDLQLLADAAGEGFGTRGDHAVDRFGVMTTVDGDEMYRVPGGHAQKSGFEDHRSGLTPVQHLHLMGFGKGRSGKAEGRGEGGKGDPFHLRHPSVCVS